MSPGSSLELPQLVDVDRQPPPVDRDDHHDQGEDLSVLVPVRAREGHEREVAGVEHQLQAQQDHQRVAPDQDPAGADAEHQRRDDEVPLHAHRPGGPSTSIIVPASPPVTWSRLPVRIRSPTEISRVSSRPVRRRARTTAPTAAISSRIDATSNASRKSVSSSRPISRGVPKPAKKPDPS